MAVAATFDQSAANRLKGIVGMVALALVVTVALFAAGRLRAPSLARRAFREHKLLDGEFVWAWDDEALTITHARSVVHLPWSKFHGWTVGPRTLLLHQSRQLFNGLPRRAVADDDLRTIVGHLRASGAPERKRFGCLAFEG